MDINKAIAHARQQKAAGDTALSEDELTKICDKAVQLALDEDTLNTRWRAAYHAALLVQLNIRYRALGALAQAREAGRQQAFEEAAKVAEERYSDHGKVFKTARASHYEHAGKTIAEELRALSRQQGEEK